MATRVLVVYATHHGATRGIAERIAEVLGHAGLDATVRRADVTDGVEAFDAFVIGSAVYAFRWLGEARRFIEHNRAVLALRPVWLYSSGPLATENADPASNEALVPRGVPELAASVKAREHRIFAGAYDPDSPPIGFSERMTRLMPAARDALPAGDFRDWHAIEAWARSIAEALRPAGVAR